MAIFIVIFSISPSSGSFQKNTEEDKENSLITEIFSSKKEEIPLFLKNAVFLSEKENRINRYSHSERKSAKGRGYISNEVIVRLKDNTDPLHLQKTDFFKNSYLVSLDPKKTSVLDFIAQYKNESSIDVIQPNYIYDLSTPIEPKSFLGKMSDTSSLKQWDIEKIDIDSIWNRNGKGQSILISIIDTGVDSDHPDLFGRVINAPTKDGCCLTCSGSSYCHGTAVAGTIAALHNNEGVLGAAPESHIYSIDVFTDGATTLRIADAIYESINAGADIINLSLGGSTSYSDFYLQEAINTAHQSGIIVIASAGNSNENASTFSPASLENVVTIAASNEADLLTGFSNYGEVIDLAAPGIRMSTTYGNADNKCQQNKGNDYCYVNDWSGTSASAPLISGILASLWSLFPDLSNDEVIQLLIDSSVNIQTQKGLYKRPQLSLVERDGVDNDNIIEEEGVNEKVFSDIIDHWAEKFILKIVEEGIMHGYEGTDLFGPNDFLTRAELSKVVLLAYDIPFQKKVLTTSFSDISRFDWFSPYIESAHSKGIVFAIDNESFVPHRKSTRAEVLQTLFLASKGKIENAENMKSSFSDVSSDDWFYEYVLWGLQQNIITGYPDGTFKPENPITRAEISKILYYAMGY